MDAGPSRIAVDFGINPHHVPFDRKADLDRPRADRGPLHPKRRSPHTLPEEKTMHRFAARRAACTLAGIRADADIIGCG